MGKRRNTAKTGDKALYKAKLASKGHRSSGTNTKKNHSQSRYDEANDDDNDGVYDKVDRYHNQREEFLKLDGGSDSESDNDRGEETEAIMDLGVGGDDSSSDSESLSGGEDHSDMASTQNENAEISSDDDDDQDNFEMEDVRDWGKRKSSYYNGDTADLEIGQEQDDAFLEEEGAKEVNAARYKDMTEDDFILSDNEEDDDGLNKLDLTKPLRDVAKLSTRDRRRVLEKQHPELLPLVLHFSSVAAKFTNETNIATEALFDGEEGAAEAVGTSKQGKRYLLTKAILEASTSLNLIMYLLLKASQSNNQESDPESIQSHPVMSNLKKLNALLHHLENRVEKRAPGLTGQLSSLVEAAALVRSGIVGVDESDDGSYESRTVSDSEDNDGQSKEDIHAENLPELSDTEDSKIHHSDQDSAVEKRVLTEARFGLRQAELVDGEVTKRSSNRVQALDFGDAVTTDASHRAVRSLASTLNTIEQKTSSRKRRAAPVSDTIDDAMNDDDELKRGIAMMEEEFGRDFDKEEEGDRDADNDQWNPEVESDGGEDDFYTKIAIQSQKHKELKKAKYIVAPKFPRVEGDVDGERAVGRAILKNRGLVAHKSKLNRNPRVKKREQYRKALIRRKGAVREIRKDEGHQYGGETTGIKSRISRSRRMAK